MGDGDMRSIRIDGRKMDTRDDAHRYLMETLPLPAHYGRNLDALADGLSECADIAITITHAAAIRNALGAYGQRLLAVFRDAALGRRDLTVQVRDGGD